MGTGILPFSNNPLTQLRMISILSSITNALHSGPRMARTVCQKSGSITAGMGRIKLGTITQSIDQYRSNLPMGNETNTCYSPSRVQLNANKSTRRSPKYRLQESTMLQCHHDFVRLATTTVLYRKMGTSRIF
jgi:hypothetical protein